MSTSSPDLAGVGLGGKGRGKWQSCPIGSVLTGDTSGGLNKGGGRRREKCRRCLGNRVNQAASFSCICVCVCVSEVGRLEEPDKNVCGFFFNLLSVASE